MSLVAQTIFDPMGCVLYLVVLVLESGIFISHWIWLFRTRKQRKLEKQEAEKQDLEAAEAAASVNEKELPSESASTPELSGEGGDNGRKAE